MEITELVGKIKKSFLTIFILGLALIIAFNIYQAQNKELDQLRIRKENEAKKNVLLAEVSTLENRIQSYKNLLGRKDPNLIMNSLSKAAQDTGVKISSIRPEAENIQPNYIKIPFSLQVIAPDYNSFGNFVSMVENDKDVYLVEDARINSSSEKGLDISLKVINVIAKE
ncbi:MAG: type 4a pilus biogenesis protein PilO [Candidatus Omnitrophica bacterium]|nr:type 4a pilus biogenesis protein PilO [Candidatus Omnitrophota bacterium]